MAVVEASAVVKARLVFQTVAAEGVKKTAKTLSNIAADAGNDALYRGMQAISGLFQNAPVQVIRVDEAELVEE